LSKIDCTEKALNENHLSNFTKEQLVSFIVKHRQKLLDGTKQHKKEYIKKPKNPFDFEKQQKVRVALKFSYLGMEYKGLAI
jgi:hypothetical protein